MKKIFNRIKTGIATFWVTIISFFSKVMGQFKQYDDLPPIESLYAVERPIYLIEKEQTLIDVIFKIAKRPLIAIAFIIWIVNFIKIRKIDDKVQKKKRIKKTIIVMSILIILIMACIITTRLLKI